MPTRLVPNSDERTNLTPEEWRQARKRSYRLLREILRPHRLSLAISVAAVILGAIASAVQPWLIARVLDTAIEPLTRGDSASLIFFVVLFGATVLANGTLTWVNVVYTVRVSLGVLLSLRTRVFQHSQSLSVSFHESYTSGRVISRLTSDIDTIRTFLDSGISQLATTLLGIAFSVIAIFLLDWRIGLLLVAMTVPIWLITRWFRTRSETAFRAMRNESAQLTSRFVETYTGIRAIKSFGAEADARTSYARNAERYRVAVMDSIKLFGIYSPVLILLGNIFVAAALVIGGYAVLGGTMQVGTLLALIIYANRVFEPIMTLSEFYNLFQSAFSALEKISGFLAERPQVREAEHPVQRQVLEGAARGAVEFQNAQFAYIEGTPALQRTSLSVPLTFCIVPSTSTFANFPLKVAALTAVWLRFVIIMGTSFAIRPSKRAVVCLRCSVICAALTIVCWSSAAAVRRLRLVRRLSTLGKICCTCGSIAPACSMAPWWSPPEMVSKGATTAVGLAPRRRFIVTPPMRATSSSAVVPWGTFIFWSNSMRTTTPLLSL